MFNEGGAVDQLVSAVLSQLQENDELVIVDGGSSDGTLARLAAWSARDERVRHISAPGADISDGRNIAVEAAQHEVIASTDANCTPVPGWLAAFRGAFADDDPPGVATGTCRVQGGTPMQDAQALACYYDPDEARRPSLPVRLYGRVFGQVFDPTYPSGRSIAFTVEAWRSVGGFPTGFLGTEDATFGRAISNAHSLVSVPDAEVSWEQAETTWGTAKMYYHYGLGPAYAGNRKLQARDGARAVAYAIVPWLTLRGNALTRAMVLAGGAAYLWLPAVRASRAQASWRARSCIPAAMATKDLSKIAGACVGQIYRLRGQRPASKVERFAHARQRVSEAGL